MQLQAISKKSHTGRAIQRWRESDEPLTKEELAAALGRSLSSVQRWEAGKIEPRVSDVRLMEKVKPGLVERLFPTRRAR